MPVDLSCRGAACSQQMPVGGGNAWNAPHALTGQAKACPTTRQSRKL